MSRPQRGEIHDYEPKPERRGLTEPCVGPGLEEECKLLLMKRTELDDEERDRLTRLVCDVDSALDRLKVGLVSLKGVGYLNQPR